jgi:hypothetical protein
VSADRFERHEPAVRLVLCAVVLLTAILTVTPWPVGGFQDDAIYTVLAKSLATGHGYRLLNLPGEPNATHFPPGYPLVLAALWRLWPSFPDNIVLFKFANTAFLAGAALGAYQFARRRLHWTVAGAAIAGATGTLSIVVLLVTGVVLSEPLFMAILFPVLLLAESSVDVPGRTRAWCAGLGVGTLALVRTIGVAVLPAALLLLLWRRRFADAALFLAGALLLLVPWQAWASAHSGEVAPVLAGKFGSYVPWLVAGYRDGGLPFLRAVVASNADSLWAMFSVTFMPVVASGPRGVAFAAVLVLALAGLAMLVRVAPVTTAFIMVYLAITLAWPFDPARFIIAVWPLVLLTVAHPIRRLWQSRPVFPVGRWARGAGLGVAAALVVAFGAYNARGYRARWWASVQQRAGERAKPLVEWTASHTRPNDVLATDDDLIIFLYAGRQAIPTSTFLARERVRPLSDEEDIAAVRAILAWYRPRFFITSSAQGSRTASALAKADPPELRPTLHQSMSTALIFERITPR